MPISFSTQARVYLQSDGTPLPGVRVALYDRDRFSADDLLGTQTTDDAGLARFSFSSAAFADRGRGFPPLVLDDGSLQPGEAPPDLYVTLLDAAGQVVHSTRPSVRWNQPLAKLSVPLTIEQARAFGFIPTKPHRSVDDKLDDWISGWRKRMTADPGPGPGIDLCFTRLILETAAGLTAPQTDAQKHAAKRLHAQIGSGRISEGQLQSIATSAAAALAHLDGAHLIDRAGCTGNDGITGLTRRIFEDGAGAPFLGSFTQHDEDPDTVVGPVGKGTGFSRNFRWNKDCLEAYRRGRLGAEARDEMAEYFPDGPTVLIPPSVNHVEIWSPPDGKTLREAWVRDRTLTLHGRTVSRGWVQRTLAMNVDLDDPNALVLQAAADGKQILAIDVRPGQKVHLRGSGFVAAQARVHATRRPWAGVNDGRLVPRADVFGAGALDGLTVDVHGATTPPMPNETAATFSRDEMVFTWPDSASAPGLYEVVFELRNESEHFTSVEQYPPDCRLHTTKDPVRTPPLYFVVLDPPPARQARVVATRVDCDDETNPERLLLINLADDVHYDVSGTLQTMVIDPNRNEPGVRVGDTTAVSGRHLFWNSHESWTPNLRAFPADAPFEVLGLDQVVLTLVTASEVEGDLDRAMLLTALVIVIVAVIVAIIAVMIVAVIAMIAVVIGLAIAEVITWGAATAIIAVIGGGSGTLVALMAIIAAFLVGAAFTAILSSVQGLVASLDGADVIADAAVAYPGVELAMRGSPIRFHRVLWLEQRGESVDTTSGTQRISSDFDAANGSLKEVFRARNLGGDYRLTVEVQTV